MANSHASYNVIRSIGYLGKPGAGEHCASFVSRALAERFIALVTVPCEEHGSNAGRWWCKQNHDVLIEYWIESDVDELVQDLLSKDAGLRVARDDGEMLQMLSGRPGRR